MIILGANDLFLLQDHCLNVPSCIAAGLPQVLGQVAINMATILGDLRTTGYKGRIVVLNYYSTDYTNLASTGIIGALNQVLKSVASREDALVADLFTAFETAALPAGGHTCDAGLLNALPQSQYLCDVHPSQSGHLLIAKTIERTLDAVEDHDERYPAFERCAQGGQPGVVCLGQRYRAPGVLLHSFAGVPSAGLPTESAGTRFVSVDWTPFVPKCPLFETKHPAAVSIR